MSQKDDGRSAHKDGGSACGVCGVCVSWKIREEMD